MKRKQIRKKTAKHPTKRPDSTYPDFAATRRRIFGKKRMKITAAEVVSEGRGEH